MKGLKTTIGLVIVLAGLVGYIYFVESKKPAAGTETKEEAFSVQADDIEEVIIKAADGETTRAQKGEAGWRVTEPVKAEGDSNQLSSIASSLSSLEIQRVVEENPTNLANYGLEPARVEVSFRTKGDGQPRRLLIGDKTPTGDDLYAKQPDTKRVFLISSMLDNTFNRTPFDLRDKSVLKYDRDKVDTVEVARGTTTLQFVKQGFEWTLEKPFHARAEFSAVEGLLGSLSTAQIQKFVEAKAGDLRTYGLDAPAVTATVSAGGTRTSLLIGKGVQDTRYAKDSSRPDVFMVSGNLFLDLQRDLDDFRRKNVFDFRPFTANRVEIRRGATTQVFEKAKDKDGNSVWQLGGKTVETAKTENSLMTLADLRADGFETASHPSLKSPEMTVIARFDDSKNETVTFGRAGGNVYAAHAGEPGAARLSASAYEDAIKALDALK